MKKKWTAQKKAQKKAREAKTRRYIAIIEKSDSKEDAIALLGWTETHKGISPSVMLDAFMQKHMPDFKWGPVGDSPAYDFSPRRQAKMADLYWRQNL